MIEDFQEKTEPPTARKLAEAKRKGYVSKSHDLIIGVMLTMSVLVMMFWAGFMFDRLKSIAVELLSNLQFSFNDPEVVIYWLRQGLQQMMIILSPMFFFVVLTAFVMNLIQTGFGFSFYPITPKWSRLNLFNSANYKRYFSLYTFLKLVMGQLRFFLVVVASWLIVGKDMFYIYTLTKGSPANILYFIFQKSLQVGLFLALSFTLIALIDLFYQKWKFYQDQRMTRREVKDEFKLSEGDLHIKSKMRTMMHSLLRQSDMQHIPRANLLITNPSRQQVIALHYQPQHLSSPLCLAKGSRKQAAEILRIAEKYQIPVLENASLAKSLYPKVQIGGFVPPAYFREVANAYAQRKKNVF